jgi:hypothetical protein
MHIGRADRGAERLEQQVTLPGDGIGSLANRKLTAPQHHGTHWLSHPHRMISIIGESFI